MQGYSDLTFDDLGASAAGFVWLTLQTTARRRRVLPGFALLRRRRTFGRPKPSSPTCAAQSHRFKRKPPRRHPRLSSVLRSPAASSPFVCRFPTHNLTLHAPLYGRSRVWMPAAPPNRPFRPCKAALVAAVCPRPEGGKALAENPLRRGQPAANQRGESGCRPYGGKPTRRRRLGRLINFRYRSEAPAKPSKIFTSICAHFVACLAPRRPYPCKPP